MIGPGSRLLWLVSKAVIVDDVVSQLELESQKIISFADDNF